MYCCNCHINWAALKSIDDDINDESVEVCPLCDTDLYLSEQLPGDTYRMAVNGDIVSLQTGQTLQRTLPAKPAGGKPSSKVKPFDKTQYELKQQWKYERENAALNAYLLHADEDKTFAENQSRLAYKAFPEFKAWAIAHYDHETKATIIQ